MSNLLTQATPRRYETTVTNCPAKGGYTVLVTCDGMNVEEFISYREFLIIRPDQRHALIRATQRVAVAKLERHFGNKEREAKDELLVAADLCESNGLDAAADVLRKLGSDQIHLSIY